jgi:hypothetical protein
MLRQRLFIKSEKCGDGMEKALGNTVSKQNEGCSLENGT